MNRKTLLMIASAALLLNSCRRNPDGPSWNTGLLFPIAQTTLSISDMLPDSLLQTNSDSSIKVVYEDDFFDFTADSLYRIKDTTLTYSTSLFAGTFTPGTTFANVIDNTTYTLPNGIQLTGGTIRSGKMKIHMVNHATGIIEVRFMLPRSFKNSVSLDTTLRIPAGNGASGAPGIRDAEIPLDGYECDFRGQLYDRVNTMLTEYTVRYDPQASTSLVTNFGETVSMDISFESITPSYVRGYFGNSTFDLNGETSIDFFRKIKSGSLNLEDLKLRFDLENNVGMDARMYINGISSLNTNNNSTVALNAPFIGQALNFNRASYSSGWPPVTPYNWSTQIDNSNSNAKALLENFPDKLHYNVKIITNPLGNVSSSNDFFYTDFPLKARISAELPLSFAANQIQLVDTIKTDFSSVENKEDILSGTLTLYADNSFPFSASVQLYTVDALGNILDSLVAAPHLIDASPVVTNMNGVVVSSGSTASVVKIPIAEDKMQQVLQSTRLVAHVFFNTSGQPGRVNIYSYNTISLRITGDFNYHFGN